MSHEDRLVLSKCSTNAPLLCFSFCHFSLLFCQLAQSGGGAWEAGVVELLARINSAARRHHHGADGQTAHGCPWDGKSFSLLVYCPAGRLEAAGEDGTPDADGKYERCSTPPSPRCWWTHISSEPWSGERVGGKHLLSGTDFTTAARVNTARHVRGVSKALHSSSPSPPAIPPGPWGWG